MQRILNNIFSNIQKYCDPWHVVTIKTKVEKGNYKMLFANAVNQHLDKVESNGIGLKGVEKMVKIQKGSFHTQTIDGLYVVQISFPLDNDK